MRRGANLNLGCFTLARFPQNKRIIPNFSADLAMRPRLVRLSSAGFAFWGRDLVFIAAGVIGTGGLSVAAAALGFASSAGVCGAARLAVPVLASAAGVRGAALCGGDCFKAAGVCGARLACLLGGAVLLPLMAGGVFGATAGCAAV